MQPVTFVASLNILPVAFPISGDRGSMLLVLSMSSTFRWVRF